MYRSKQEIQKDVDYGRIIVQQGSEKVEPNRLSEDIQLLLTKFLDIHSGEKSKTLFAYERYALLILTVMELEEKKLKIAVVKGKTEQPIEKDDLIEKFKAVSQGYKDAVVDEFLSCTTKPLSDLQTFISNHFEYNNSRKKISIQEAAIFRLLRVNPLQANLTILKVDVKKLMMRLDSLKKLNGNNNFDRCFKPACVSDFSRLFDEMINILLSNELETTHKFLPDIVEFLQGVYAALVGVSLNHSLQPNNQNSQKELKKINHHLESSNQALQQELDTLVSQLSTCNITMLNQLTKKISSLQMFNFCNPKPIESKILQLLNDLITKSPTHSLDSFDRYSIIINELSSIFDLDDNNLSLWQAQQKKLEEITQKCNRLMKKQLERGLENEYKQLLAEIDQLSNEEAFLSGKLKVLRTTLLTNLININILILHPSPPFNRVESLTSLSKKSDQSTPEFDDIVRTLTCRIILVNHLCNNFESKFNLLKKIFSVVFDQEITESQARGWIMLKESINIVIKDIEEFIEDMPDNKTSIAAYDSFQITNATIFAHLKRPLRNATQAGDISSDPTASLVSMSLFQSERDTSRVAGDHTKDKSPKSTL